MPNEETNVAISQAEASRVYEGLDNRAMITVAGYVARVKQIAQRDDGVVHAIVRRSGFKQDEIAHHDPRVGVWHLGKSKR